MLVATLNGKMFSYNRFSNWPKPLVSVSWREKKTFSLFLLSLRLTIAWCTSIRLFSCLFTFIVFSCLAVLLTRYTNTTFTFNQKRLHSPEPEWRELPLLCFTDDRLSSMLNLPQLIVIVQFPLQSRCLLQIMLGTNFDFGSIFNSFGRI